MSQKRSILVIGKFYTEGFGLHIAETLEAMGHAVRRFEPGLADSRIPGEVGRRLDQVRHLVHGASHNLPAIRARRMRALWAETDRGPIDAVIVCHDFLWPEEVAELKGRTKAPVALWFPDHLANFGRAFFMTAPYDALFFKDPYIVRLLSQVLDTPVHFLPECYNPQVHRLPEGAEIAADYRCDVTTAGNLHSWRGAYLRQLTAYHVRLWGSAPPLWFADKGVRAMYQGRPVLNADKARAFLGAKIVLNNLHFAEVWGSNVRMFEAAGIGAFQLVDWRPGVSQLFEDGRQLVTFRGVEDLKRLIEYYLPREEERKAIAEAGKHRAQAEHTYRHRLDLLLSTLAGSARGFPLPTIDWAGPS